MSDIEFERDKQVAVRLRTRFIDAIADEGAVGYPVVFVCLAVVAAELGMMSEDERRRKQKVVVKMLNDMLDALTKFGTGGIQ